MTTALVEQCRTYLGVPFRHKGRNRHGVDCAGLLVASFKDLGRDIKDIRAYGREPHKDGLRQAVQANLGKPSREPLAVGDIVLMKFVENPHHLGIIGNYLHGGLSLIHSYGSAGKVVEHILDDVWKARIIEHYKVE